MSIRMALMLIRMADSADADSDDAASESNKPVRKATPKEDDTLEKILDYIEPSEDSIRREWIQEGGEEGEGFHDLPLQKQAEALYGVGQRWASGAQELAGNVGDVLKEYGQSAIEYGGEFIKNVAEEVGTEVIATPIAGAVVHGLVALLGR